MYIKKKPDPVPQEFLTLISIIMEEDNLHMPNNCHEALELYLDLLTIVDAVTKILIGINVRLVLTVKVKVGITYNH